MNSILSLVLTVFPPDGVEWNSCLPYGDKFWCALEKDFELGWSSNWGYCDHTCPQATTTTTSVPSRSK